MKPFAGMKTARPALMLTLCAGMWLLTACANQHQGLYQWGSYESQLYAMYSDGGKTSPEVQIQKLEADLEKAKSANRPVPPGYHAHLGYLYYQTGKSGAAVQSLNAEKTLFPESTIYMDRLIARIKP